MALELPTDIAATIPAEVLSDASVQRYNNLGDMMKGHIELNSYRGRSIALPNGESKPEDWDKWTGETSAKLKDHGFTIAKLDAIPQVPANPEAYDFKYDGVQNETLKADALLAEFRKDAHAAGFTNKQAQTALELLGNKYLPQLMPPLPEFIEGVEPVKAMLQEAFKADFTQINDNYNLAIRNLKMDNPEFEDVLKDSFSPYKGKLVSVFDHPVMRKIFADIGARMQQDFGGNLTGAALQASNDAQSEIDKIRTDDKDPRHALWLKGDKATLAHMDDLYKQLTGGR